MIAALLLAVPGFSGKQSVLGPVGPQSARIEHLFSLIFWITAVVYVLVIATLAIGIWRKHAHMDSMPAPMPTDPAADKFAERAVVGASIFTVALLFVMLIGSFLTSHAIAALTVPNPVTINVYGHQWWWELEYPRGDAYLQVNSANEIHLPVGVPVMIHSTSRDVIHSFWAPNIHGKRDLLPGYQNDLWIQVDHPGTWRGQCAEFCGLQHAHMAFTVIAEPRAEYEKWLNRQIASAPDPSNPQAAHGQQVFLTHTCVMCHTVRGTTAAARTGPDLTHLASRQTIAAGTLPNNRGSLAGWIANAQAIKPGVRMPPNPMPAQDLEDLLTYLETLK